MSVPGDRAKRMRALAAALQAECGIPVEARYDGAGWVLGWSNGPVTLHGLAAALAPGLGLDPAVIGLRRIVQDDAMPVQAIRLGRAGQLPLHDPPAAAAAIEWAAQATGYPDQPDGPAEAALAARLTAEAAAQPGTRWADASTVAALICQHGGIGWLLTPAPAAPSAAGGGLDAALAVLTAAYARGQARQDWTRRGTVLDTATALAAVRADPAPDPAAACAGLTVLRAQAGDLERAELRLLDTARSTGATWAQLATAINAGTRQAAYKRHRDLTRRHPDGQQAARKKAAAR